MTQSNFTAIKPNTLESGYFGCVWFAQGHCGAQSTRHVRPAVPQRTQDAYPALYIKHTILWQISKSHDTYDQWQLAGGLTFQLHALFFRSSSNSFRSIAQPCPSTETCLKSKRTRQNPGFCWILVDFGGFWSLGE